MLEAVFFDFDGVIADSEPLHLRGYQAVLRADGIDLDKSEYYSRYLGYDDVGLFEALANDRRLSLTAAKIDEWVAAKSRIVEEMLTNGSVLFPGAAACVKAFAERVPLAVASGALEPEIEIVLTHAGLRSHFAAIASASDGVRGKPEPDLYLLAIAKLRDRLPHPSTRQRASPLKTRTGDSRRPAVPDCIAWLSRTPIPQQTWQERPTSWWTRSAT